VSRVVNGSVQDFWKPAAAAVWVLLAVVFGLLSPSRAYAAFPCAIGPSDLSGLSYTNPGDGSYQLSSVLIASNMAVGSCTGNSFPLLRPKGVAALNTPQTTSAGGKVQRVSATSVSYQAPSTNFSGTDTFDLDSGNSSFVVTVTVNVTAPAVPPTVTGVSPTSGSAAGGTSVVITGTNFSTVSGASGVRFGAANAASYAINSATQITANSPAGSAGTVDITVTNPGGTSATSAADQFTYVAAPTVTAVSPTSGATAGGATVTITGTGFSAAAATGAVKFGAATATYTINSNTQITATSPAGSAGTVDITVTTAGGTSATSAADQFTYVAAPTVTAVSPTAGPTAGGTTVTITGTGFSAAAATGAVKFGAATATYTINSNTQITATSPAGSAGTADITVTTAGGTSATSAADQFTYVAAPTVTAVSPTSGPTAGGTTVTLTGTGFSAAAATGAVKFGATTATYAINSNTQITATSPAGSAGTVDITVTTAGGTSATSAADQFTYVATPTVTAVSPNAGPTGGGASVTITGTGFSTAAATGAVKFGGTTATYTINSNTQITATSPAGAAGTVDITVTNPSGTSPTSAADQFTYVAAPTVTAVSPTSGAAAGGATVTITGTGFSAAAATGAVKFGGTTATYAINSNTQITATSPAGAAGTVDITVTTAGGTSATSAADQFTYIGAPTVTAVSPTAGPTAGGTTVTITGAGFSAAAATGAVKFGAATATYTINSNTQITATSPAGAAGTVDITVTTAGGTSATSAADQFTYVAAPTLGSVSPTSGPDAGGATVVLTGTNLSNVTSVKFGSTNATGFTVDSATQITATSPPGAAGAVDVSIVSAGGSANLTAAYTYVVSPAVTALSPATGPVAGGTSVTLTGAHLSGATAVKFGATNATSFTLDSATQITAVAPAAAAGSVNVTVVTAGGASGAAAGNAYTYAPVPTLASILPTAGPTGGGNAVVINGTGFTGATTVKFGAINATTFTVNSATQITATAPAGSAGTVDVVVTTAGGAGTLVGAYRYAAAPTVSGLSPTSGPAGGANSVVVTGTNFTGATVVKFGTTNATSFTVDSGAQITAVAPAGSGGVDVTVTAPGGTSATSAGSAYAYIAAPAITSLSPTFGPAAGGTSIVLTGSNFTGATAVKFGATNATSFTVDSATQITAVAPAGAVGVVSVTVTSAGGTSAGASYTYGNGPSVTALSPILGPIGGGTSVVLTGANFTGATAVRFGATNATSFNIDSATQITAVAPARAAGSVNVTVTTSVGTSAAASANAYQYVAAPTISALAPSSGAPAGGASVVVTGTGFTGVTSVKFGATNAASFTVDSATQITAVSPPGSGSVSVTVTAAGGAATSSATFAYVAPTVIVVAGTTPDGAVGRAYNAGFSASGGAAPYAFSLIAGALPPGLSLSAAGDLTGAPTTAGVYAFTVQASAAGGGTGSTAFSLTIRAADLALTGAAPDGVVGEAYTAAFSASGGAAPYAFTVSSGSLPTGLTLGANGALTGAPTTPGAYAFTVQVKDAAGASGATAFTVTIRAPDLVLSGAAPDVAVGVAYSASFSAAGGQSPYRFSVAGALPAGITFDAARGTLTGAPTTAGQYSVTVTVTDSTPTTPRTASKVFTLTVTTPTPPQVNPVTAPTGAPGAPVVIAVGDRIFGVFTEIVITQQPRFGRVSVQGGALQPELVYVPNSGYVGPDTFFYAASGPGGQSRSARIVIGALPPPTAAPDTAVAGSAKPTPINVTTNDSGFFDTVTVASGPSFGTVKVDGLVATYASKEGFSGLDTFTYVLSGPGGDSLPVEVRVTVNPQASAAPPKAVTIVAGQTAVVDLTEGATGGPFVAAAVIAISPSNAGVAAISAPSTGRYSLTFTPDGAFSGVAEIQYSIANATSVSAPGKVTVTVTPRPDPTQDPEVRGLIVAQDAAARRFANAQIGNFNRRLEQLHHGGGLGTRGDVALQGGLTYRNDGVEAREEMRRRAGYGAAFADDVGALRPADVRSAGTLGRTQAAGGGSNRVGKPKRWGVWASGNVDVGLREAVTGQDGFRFTTDGLTAGADYRVGPRLAIGLGVGYGRDASKVGHDGTKSRAEGVSGGVYLSYQPTENGFVDGVLGLGRLDFDSRRFVTSTGALVTGSRAGDQAFAALTAGLDHRRKALMVSPYGRIAYSQSVLDPYTETGGGMWALTYQSQKIRSLTGSLGLRASYRHTVAAGDLTPRLRIEYTHDFEGSNGAGVRYADWQASPVYRLAIEGVDRNLARLELGMDLRLNTGLRLGLDFDNTLAANSESHGLRLSIESAF